MPQTLLITINGTGVPGPFDDGPTSFPGWAGWAVADPWINILAQFWGPQWQQQVTWLPTGYPAAVSNMWASTVKGAQATLQTLLTGGGIHNGPWPLGTPICIFGYSQGSMVANYIGVNYFLDPNGSLHDRYLNGDLAFIFNVGDPNRCPGVAEGNVLAGIPLPPEVDGDVTGGISGPGIPSKGVMGCLTLEQTEQLNVYSLVLPGDLYADAPVGSSPWNSAEEVERVHRLLEQIKPMDLQAACAAVQANPMPMGSEAAAGYVGTLIFNAVQVTGITNVIKVMLALGHPIGMVEEIINGMKFAAAGPNAPHFQYGPYVPVVLDQLQQVVESVGVTPAQN